MKVIRYDSTRINEWNEFISESKNGTFLLNRNFMDYHFDRFNDFSLMIYNNLDVLVALFPLSILDKKVCSHGGLTFGGFILGPNSSTQEVLEVFDFVLEFLKSYEVEAVTYKAIPYIYHKRPSDEDLYGLFRYGFKLIRRDVSSAINMRTTEINRRKQSGYRKAIKEGVLLRETSDCSDILRIANVSLKEKYGVSTVHTSLELNMLRSRFPKNIIFFELILAGRVDGGVVLFADNNVVHAQYIATSLFARQKRGLDYIVVALVDTFKSSYEWFDYGISTEMNGVFLNKGLISSKEEYGFSAMCYDTYLLDCL